MSPEDLDRLVAAMARVHPTMDYEGLGEQVVALNVDETLIGTLAGMSLALNDRPNVPVTVFVDELVSAIQELDKKIVPPNGDWTPLKAALTQLINPNGALAYTAKATQLSREYENIYREGRILSDIRPIFPRDSNKPEFAAIVHLLRVGYRDASGGAARIIFALDRSDLRELKETIDRAIRKDESLHAIISAAGLGATDPGSRQK